MRWRVIGEVDGGSITFPNFVVVRREYTANGWDQARIKGKRLLTEASNHLGSPVNILSLTRIDPPIPKH